MALLPVFFSELNNFYCNRGRNFSQFLDDFTPMVYRRGFYVPRTLRAANLSDTSVIQRDKNTFEVTLDVQHFAPKELTVKTSDNYIVVEGKHEEKQDEHGYISRHFIRKYKLPEDHDSAEIVSNLSSDGVLTIISKKQKMLEANERNIPITLTEASKPVFVNGDESKSE